MGPVELLVVEFRGNHFKGEIVPALKNVIDKGLIRVVDLVFVKKNKNGQVDVYELQEMEEDIAEIFNSITSDVNGMISQDDIQKLSEDIQENSSVGFLAIEHLWASELKDAIRNADGRLVFDTLVPAETAEKALESATASQP